jgi:hypothetical protein
MDEGPRFTTRSVSAPLGACAVVVVVVVVGDVDVGTSDRAASAAIIRLVYDRR